MRTLANVGLKKGVMSILSNSEATSIYKVEQMERELLCEDLGDAFEDAGYFGDRVYIREFKMKSGQFVTGRVHRTDHVFILVSGSILMWDHHVGVKALQGYNSFESKSGTKRAIIAYEDTIILTAHYAEPELTHENAKENLAFKQYDEYLQYESNRLNPSETKALPKPAQELPTAAREELFEWDW